MNFATWTLGWSWDSRLAVWLTYLLTLILSYNKQVSLHSPFLLLLFWGETCIHLIHLTFFMQFNMWTWWNIMLMSLSYFVQYIHYYLTTCLHCVAMAISPHTCYTCLHAWGNGNKSPILLTSDHESTHTLGLLVIEFQKNTIDLDWPTFCYIVLVITFDMLHYVSYELQTSYTFTNLVSCVLNLCLLTNYFSSWHLILTCFRYNLARLGLNI